MHTLHSKKSRGVISPECHRGKTIGIIFDQKVGAPSHPLPHLSHPFHLHFLFLFPFPATQFQPIKGLGSAASSTVGSGAPAEVELGAMIWHWWKRFLWYLRETTAHICAWPTCRPLAITRSECENALCIYLLIFAVTFIAVGCYFPTVSSSVCTHLRWWEWAIVIFSNKTTQKIQKSVIQSYS